MTDMTSPADAKVELAPRLELVERIKQLRAERKRYFDVEGDTVDLVLADCHAALEASADTPTEAIIPEMIEAGYAAFSYDMLGKSTTELVSAIYTAMQAARPIAPMQDDER